MLNNKMDRMIMIFKNKIMTYLIKREKKYNNKIK